MPRMQNCPARNATHVEEGGSAHVRPDVAGTKFDVILVDPPWEEYRARRIACGSFDNAEDMEVWTPREIMGLRVDLICDTRFCFLAGAGVSLRWARACLRNGLPPLRGHLLDQVQPRDGRPRRAGAQLPLAARLGGDDDDGALPRRDQGDGAAQPRRRQDPCECGHRRDALRGAPLRRCRQASRALRDH